MTTDPEAGDLAIYSSPDHQRVDYRSRMNSFEMSAAEETTTAATMTIASETVDLHSRPSTQRIQDHGSDTSALGKTKTTEKTTDSIFCTYEHSDHSKMAIETCSSSGGGVSIADTTKSSSTPVCKNTLVSANSIEQQMKEFHTTVSCVDSGDNLINLPDDLIREVLRRLNVRDVVRLGSLNKSWRSELQRILYDEGNIWKQYHSRCQLRNLLVYSILARKFHEVGPFEKDCDRQFEDDGAEIARLKPMDFVIDLEELNSSASISKWMLPLN